MAVVAGLGAHRVHAIILSAASVPPEAGNGFDCMDARHRDGARQGAGRDRLSWRPRNRRGSSVRACLNARRHLEGGLGDAGLVDDLAVEPAVG
jgi:hypothetical protein